MVTGHIVACYRLLILSIAHHQRVGNLHRWVWYDSHCLELFNVLLGPKPRHSATSARRDQHCTEGPENNLRRSPFGKAWGLVIIIRCRGLTKYLQLPYLTAVIKEGMRIQPPVGLIPTRAAETDVDYGGITFTKGVSACAWTQSDLVSEIKLTPFDRLKFGWVSTAYIITQNCGPTPIGSTPTDSTSRAKRTPRDTPSPTCRSAWSHVLGELIGSKSLSW